MYPPVRQFETRALEVERELARRAALTRPAPPRYKLALLTWAGAYALITAILALFGHTLAAWPLMLRTLVLSSAMVAGLTWIVMPRLTRLFGPWLHARRGRTKGG